MLLTTYLEIFVYFAKTRYLLVVKVFTDYISKHIYLIAYILVNEDPLAD